jgi:hypothetical protein
MSANTAVDRYRYSKQFYNVLQSGDAQSLLALAPNKRIHAMKAISSLARYTGAQSDWITIRKKYGLSWSTGTEKIDAFSRLFDDSRSLETMIDWLRQARQVLPRDYSDFFLFCTLTGLRCSEALASVALIKDPETFRTYYDSKAQMLLHYTHPATFIRRTKSCFVSILDDELLSVAQRIEKIRGYNGLKSAIRRTSTRLDMRIKYCRKINNSWLRQSGIQAEVVDMLSGRISKNIFLRHYYTPSLQYKQDVLDSLHRLKQTIEQ